MKNEPLSESLAAFEAALAEPMVAVPVEKAAPDAPAAFKVRKIVHRDAANRIASVEEIHEPADPAVEKAQRTLNRMKTADILKLARDLADAELLKRGVVSPTQPLTKAEMQTLKEMRRPSKTTLEDLDVSQ